MREHEAFVTVPARRSGNFLLEKFELLQRLINSLRQCQGRFFEMFYCGKCAIQ